jgi:hypothetical protein
LGHPSGWARDGHPNTWGKPTPGSPALEGVDLNLHQIEFVSRGGALDLGNLIAGCP